MLERSGLIRSSKTGRVRTYELVPEQLRVAEDWLAAQRSMWEARLDRFAEYVATSSDLVGHWHNAVRIDRPVAEYVETLKQLGAGDIGVHGSTPRSADLSSRPGSSMRYRRADS